MVRFYLPILTTLAFWLPVSAQSPLGEFNNLDYIVTSGDSIKLTIFPAFDFQYFVEPNTSHFFNSRGIGLQFESGGWTVYTVVYDNQINNMTGSKSDSTLYGLNFVRFKGKGDPFVAGKASSVDFDDADGFIRYQDGAANWFYGKAPLVMGPSKRNNLLFNGTSGSFPYFSFSWKNQWLDYRFGYAFLKYIGNNKPFQNKAIAYHYLSLQLFDHWTFYGYEGMVQLSHSIKSEYFNPFLFFRSTDHYNKSPDNALLGFGFIYQRDNWKIYSDLLIDDLETSKLFTGWFRNKTAGLLGSEWSYQMFGCQTVSSLELVYVTPHTFSHRNSVLNITHYGTPLGPELGPNSAKIGFYNSITVPDYHFKIDVNYELLAKGLSTAMMNFGDDIEIGHPDLYGQQSPNNPSLKFDDYPPLLSGNRVYTNMLELNLVYQWFGIDWFFDQKYYTNHFYVPHIFVDQGYYLTIGMKYRFDLFDRVKPEFW